MPTPCESCPVRFAVTRLSATSFASRGSLPPAATSASIARVRGPAWNTSVSAMPAQIAHIGGAQRLDHGVIRAASLLVWRRDALRRVVVYIHDPFVRSPSHEMRVRANAYRCSAGRAPGTRATLSVQADPPHRALCGWPHLRHPRQADRAEARRAPGTAR